MRKSSIKRLTKDFADIAIITFGVLFLNDKLNLFEIPFSNDIRNVLVILYLVFSMYYYRMELKDKERIIEDLKNDLKKKN